MKRIYPRVSNKPLPNNAKGPLPVDVRRSTTLLLKLPSRELSNDDVDGKEDVKKAIGLLRKTTTSACITPFCTFLYRPSTTYDVKVPN